MSGTADFNFEEFSPEEQDDICDRDYNFRFHSNIDWEAQLDAIHRLIVRNREAGEEFSEFIKNNEKEVNDYSGPFHNHYVDEHYALCHDSVYRDATESMAAIGMVAPMIESTLAQTFISLGKMYEAKSICPPDHKRWVFSKNNKDRWLVSKFFKSEKKVESNIIKGFAQLSEASGFDLFLSNDFIRWFEAMFSYRNSMFHGGFEWTFERRQKFWQQIESNGWENYFSFSTSDGEPWIFYLTNQTILDMPGRVDKLLDDLGRFAKNLPAELFSEP